MQTLEFECSYDNPKDKDLAGPGSPSPRVDSAGREMPNMSHDGLPDNNYRRVGNVRGCSTSVVPSNKQEPPAELESTHSSGNTSIILRNEPYHLFTKTTKANHENPAPETPCSQPQTETGDHDFDRYFEGVPFSQYFGSTTLTDSHPEADLTSEVVAASQGASVQKSSDDFATAMTDEEFLAVADGAAFRIAAAEAIPPDSRVRRAGTGAPGPALPRSVAPTMSAGGAGAAVATHSASAAVNAICSSVEDFGMTDEELLEIAARGTVIGQVGSTTKTPPFGRGADATGSGRTAHRVGVVARVPETAGFVPAPARLVVGPKIDPPCARAQTPASETAMSTSFELSVQEQGVSPAAKLSLPAGEVVAREKLASRAVRPPRYRAAAASGGEQNMLQTPLHISRAPPFLRSRSRSRSPSSASTLPFTGSEVAALSRVAAAAAPENPADATPAGPHQRTYPYLSIANVVLVPPADRTADAAARPDPVGMALRGAHRAAVEAALVAQGWARRGTG
ncbi:hypothetical protein MMC34_000124 [Xylographa carneopallida]|nr:hypothetical protein [Xylographa carneopallida]